MQNLKKRLVLASAPIVLGVSALPAHAVDYTAAATSATTEVNAAITAALPVGIIVMAAVIGWRLFKRFAKG